MPKSYIRVRALQTRHSTDGQTTIVVLRGTCGSARYVTPGERRAGERTPTVLIYWDAVLLNDDGCPDDEPWAASWEESGVPVDAIEFVGVAEEA